MEGSMRVYFIVANRFGSAQMRGYQIGINLAKKGIETKVLDLQKIDQNFLRTISNHDIIVMVKSPSYHIVETLKSKTNARIVLDIIDEFYVMKEMALLREKYTCFDAYIVTSEYQKIYLRDIIGINKQIWYIPQHHTNFHNQINSFKKNIESIGFQGALSNRLSAELETKLIDFCECNKLKWKTFYTENIPEVNNDLLGYETSKIIHQQLNEIDIGVIFPPSPHKAVRPTFSLSIPEMSKDEYLWYCLLFKPATRLLNFFSHGIPTICYPYVSYLHAAANSGYNLFCSEESELFKLISRSFRDVNLRSVASNQGVNIANMYSIDRIVRIYYDHFVSLSNDVTL
jgi:hypothetical protein